MPSMPPTLRPSGSRPRMEARRDYDERRRAEKPWRAWYKTRRWQARRSRQLRDEPLCAMCLRDGVTTAATIADHVEPHRGDEALFFDGRLQSLCKWHHDKAKQSEERRR